MIAHSLPNSFFGPAANMHGATYVVDARFSSEELDEHNVVIDIGLAHKCLKDSIDPLNYANLDELEQFSDTLTTTEYLARYIHKQLGSAISSDFKGTLRITLHESHIASASYEGPAGS